MTRSAKMKCWIPAIMASIMLAAIATSATPPSRPDKGAKPGVKHDTRVTEKADNVLPDLQEARGRARLLHDALHATLQIVHRRFYREDEGLPIPARTLQAVFDILDQDQKIQLRWISVNAQAMNVDHEPRDDFEKRAAQALAAGKPEYESVEPGVYRHAGAVTLSSECLKCHLPQRTSTEARAAGLVISIPVRQH